MVYRQKTPAEIPGIKKTRGWYQIVHNTKTKQYHLRRIAVNGQVLWWTEGYANEKDARTSLLYPAYDESKDLLEPVNI